MKELDMSIFKAINSFELPSIVDSVLPFLYGYSYPEVVFMILAVVCAAAALLAPRRGPKAAGAALICSFAAGFISSVLTGKLDFVYPKNIPNLHFNERVILNTVAEAFPVPSVMICAAVIGVFLYYFPSITFYGLSLILLYALGPVYLGVAFPFNVAVSVLVGFFMSYALMQGLSSLDFFNRHTK